MKNLKKYFGMFLILAFCSFSAMSCINLSIEDLVEVANSKCPNKINNGMTINKITYANKVVEYFVSIDENTMAVDASDENIETLRNALIEVYKPSVKEDPLLEAIVKQDLTLKFNFSGTISGDLFYIEIYADDLK